MALVVPNGAETDFLTLVLNDNRSLRLFTNNVTPGETDTTATFTEAAGNGYAAITVTGSAAWTIVAGGNATASHSIKTFTFTGALGNVYGYYITTNGNNNLAWAERFSGAPINIQNNGDKINITVKLECD